MQFAEIDRDTVRWFWGRIRELKTGRPAWWRFALSVFLTKHDGFWVRSEYHMIAGGAVGFTRKFADELLAHCQFKG